jgi:type II secretory pathway component PulF
MPIEISETRVETASTKVGALLDRVVPLRARKPGAHDRMFFTEQLSLLLETGTPLHAALQALKAQLRNANMLDVLDGLAEKIGEGKAFSAALGQYPELFPATYVNLVHAAENGGFLDKVLLELLKMDEKRDALRRTIVSALSYPIFLILFSIGVVLFVLVVVFPKFADMFSAIRDQLPFTTLFLMGASDVLRQQWPLLLGGLLAALAVSVYWLRTPSGREVLDQSKMRLFYFRDIFIQIYLVQSLRVIGLSLANGVSVMDALGSCREVVQNRVFRRFIGGIEERVHEGAGFAIAFQQADFIPPAVRQMVTTGEATGNLPRVLSRIADYYERELGKRLATFSRLVEPVMLLVMGGVVGLIVSSLILPIFKLSRAVG